MQRVGRAQALDGGHLVAVAGHGQRQAGVHPQAVHQNRAGAALAMVAALLRARQAQLLAQGVQQGDARIEVEGP